MNAAQTLWCHWMNAESRSEHRDTQPGPSGFSELFLRFEAELRRLVAGMGFSPADADDVLQDVYVEVLRRPGEYRSDEEVRRWLVRVTVNRCVLEFRRRRRFDREAGEILARQDLMKRSAVNPAAYASQAEELERVRACLQGLDESLLAPMVLRYFNGMTSEQIGGVLGLPAGTIRSQLYKGRMELARRLMEGGDRP